MILIDSIYINNSGGRVLLDYLVKKIFDKKIDAFFLFDQRCQDAYEYIPQDRKCYLVPNSWKRHLFYLENRKRFKKVLCFGNIPPTLRLGAQVFTYFHNPLYFQTSTWHTSTAKLYLFFLD